MTDRETLRKELAERGYTLVSAAWTLGIPPGDFIAKVQGEQEFRASEISRFARLFGEDCADAIFFANDGDY